MNKEKVGNIVLAISLSIILMTPFVISSSTTIGVSEESTGIPEMDIAVRYTGCFIENKGQLGNDEIIFYSEIPGGTIGFAESKVLLWSHDSENIVELSFPESEVVNPQGINPVSEYFNYFLGQRGTFTHLRGFESVLFENLWSGIDLVYKDTLEGAKYEFRVSPGANPSDIRVRCEGHDEFVVDDTDITITKGETAFRDVGLLVLQENDRTVQAEYLRLDHQTYGVEVGEYDRSETLIVDPLIFSTFLGGNLEDKAVAPVVDAQDNILVTGWTYSNNFPIASAYNDTFGGDIDIFVTKLDSEGSLLYSTYIGGLLIEYSVGIDIDENGEIYVVGYTVSPDFPTTGGVWNATPNGGVDIVIFKLTTTGDSLVFSTFVGGSDTDLPYSMDTRWSATEGGSWIYVTGFTMSADFPTVQYTTPGWNETYSAGMDIFVFVMHPNGTFLPWSNIVGGSNNERGTNIAVDSGGWAMVTGYTDSDDLPTTASAYDNTSNGDNDCFCLAFNREGTVLEYLTYVGGSNNDRGYGLTVEPDGTAYVTGVTYSEDFPTTSNAYDESYNQGGDAFVFKLDPWGEELSFSTYIGGFGEDLGFSILLDSSDDLIVSGRTESTNFPILYAFNSSHNGDVDAFLSKLSFDGTTLVSSTYLGGSGEEYISGAALAFDNDGNVILVGGTNSTDFPTSGNQIYDASFNGADDAFVMIFTSDFGYPEFDSVTRSILTPTSLDSVQIAAVVSDPEGVTQVTLQYRTNGAWENVTMVENLAGSNNWTGNIPTHPVNTTVEYRVVASDAAGNSVVSVSGFYVVLAPPPLVIDQNLIIAIVGFGGAALGIVGGLIKLRTARIERETKRIEKSTNGAVINKEDEIEDMQ